MYLLPVEVEVDVEAEVEKETFFLMRVVGEVSLVEEPETEGEVEEAA